MTTPLNDNSIKYVHEATLHLIVFDEFGTVEKLRSRASQRHQNRQKRWGIWPIPNHVLIRESFTDVATSDTRQTFPWCRWIRAMRGGRRMFICSGGWISGTVRAVLMRLFICLIVNFCRNISDQSRLIFRWIQFWYVTETKLSFLWRTYFYHRPL